jgi:hypothetical protein
VSTVSTEGFALTNKQHASVLNSIRSDAKKIREAIDRMEEDANKLGNTPSGIVLRESITVFRVALKNVREVFHVDL